MHSIVAGALLLTAIAAVVLLPGYSAYIGAYIAILASIVALILFGWRERSVFRHPTALAVLGAVALLTGVLPFVYHSPQDLLAPVLVLPMLGAISLAVLARPARWMPDPATFGALCLAGSAIALVGGAVEHYWLGVLRPGLGNNPIHYGSLAAMIGCLSLVGTVGARRAWRYLFMLGPVFALGAAAISGSRGPLLGACAMTGVGIFTLLIWYWRDTVFRIAVLASATIVAIGAMVLVGSGNSRVTTIMDTALNIFRFTGGSDDIRAALYTSAVEVLKSSPIFGVGLGQIMFTAQTLFPEQPGVWHLENLHADWANFAAMGGGMGLLAWLLLLAAPLLLLLDGKARRDRPIVMGALLLTSGQLTLGISNATFGILPQTTLYAVALGYLFARAIKLNQATE